MYDAKPNRLVEAEALIRHFAGKFRFYEQQHVEKYHNLDATVEQKTSTRHKALVNAELASMAEAFLGSGPTPPLLDEPPYSELAMRTEAQTYFPPDEDREGLIIADMAELITVAASLNRHKSFLFYGKDKPVPNSFLYARAQLDNIVDKKRLHALLGIASEAGELLENLFRELQGVDSQLEQEEIDANYSEESGDIDWFQEQLAKSVAIPVEDSRRDNIDKLRKRYPSKFTVEAAVARADKLPDELSPNLTHQALFDSGE